MEQVVLHDAEPLPKANAEASLGVFRDLGIKVYRVQGSSDFRC